MSGDRGLLKRRLAIGLMSGTSADGVDAALIETDGETIFATGAHHFVEYSAQERALILSMMQRAIAAGSHDERRVLAAELAPMVTRKHADAVLGLLELAGIETGSVDVVGFHGQTLFHEPPSAFTLQAGDGALLAELVSIPVVYDFRSEDMRAGGQGAPLVPVYHRALFHKAISECEGTAGSGLKFPVAVVNIGGVANVTYIGGADDVGQLLAFDTGPGNVLVDEWVTKFTGERMDFDGRYAAAGRVDEAAVERFMEQDYFKALPPKALDRYDLKADLPKGMGLEDGAATLVAMTVRSIAGARAFMEASPSCWVIVGGGAKNAAMMRMLGDVVDAPVRLAEELGWNGGYVEAEAFGFLAVRHMAGLALTFPGTTGVKAPQAGGVLVEVC